MLKIFRVVKGAEPVAQLDGPARLLAKWNVCGIEPGHAQGPVDLLNANAQLGNTLDDGFHGLRVDQLEGLGVAR